MQPFEDRHRLNEYMLKPLPAGRWNYSTAAHLLNRAGFGGEPAEIEKLLEMGPDRAVSQLVDYEKIPDSTVDPEWARPDPGRVEMLAQVRQMNQEMRGAGEEKRKELEEKRRMVQRGQRQQQQRQMLELRAWWLERMAKGPRPLQEKLTLFWHGHFATSTQKVRESYYMWLQNNTFRKHALGNWLEMLTAVSKDPAMLIWLDQAQSRKQRPNENFAREVMELFALGEGHYTEKDVTEAARAFTGWSLDRARQRFLYRPATHDNGQKTVLSRTGELAGDDVLAAIVAQPQSARFICARLWSFFASENPSEELVNALAAVFRQNNQRFAPLLRTLFRSEEFYEPEVIRTQVKSPVQWLVGSARLLERELPVPRMAVNILRELGQELFAPPNVKGWDGGIAWITTNNLLSRYNYAAFLVMGPRALPNAARGRVERPMMRAAERAQRAGMNLSPVEASRLFTANERSTTDKFVAALGRRFIQGELRGKQSKALRDFLETRGDLDDGVVLEAARLVMSTPEYQLT